METTTPPSAHIGKKDQQSPVRQKMTKTQVISLLSANANLMDEQEDLTDYINSLDWNSGQNVETLPKGYHTLKDDKYNKELAAIAHNHGLQTADLKTFVEKIMSRMIFDGEKLTDLLQPLELSWKERRLRERVYCTTIKKTCPRERNKWIDGI